MEKYVLIRQHDYCLYYASTKGENYYSDSLYDLYCVVENELLMYYLKYNVKRECIISDRVDLLVNHVRFKLYLTKDYKIPKSRKEFRDTYLCKNGFYGWDIINPQYKDETLDNLLLQRFIWSTANKIARRERVFSYNCKNVRKEILTPTWYRPMHRHHHHSCHGYHNDIVKPKYRSVAQDPEISLYIKQREIQTEVKWSSRWSSSGWKYSSKCRKQWMQHIKNPSSEKLSYAVWKRELEDEENMYE